MRLFQLYHTIKNIDQKNTTKHDYTITTLKQIKNRS